MDVQRKPETNGADTSGNSDENRPAHWFKPGQSGNPKGRPKVPTEVKRLAREASPRAMQRLIELIEDDDARVAMMAAKEVLDRAYGKVAAAEDDDDKNSKNVTINILKMTSGGNGRDNAAPQLDAEAVSVRTLAISGTRGH